MLAFKSLLFIALSCFTFSSGLFCHKKRKRALRQVTPTLQNVRQTFCVDKIVRTGGSGSPITRVHFITTRGLGLLIANNGGFASIGVANITPLARRLRNNVPVAFSFSSTLNLNISLSNSCRDLPSVVLSVENAAAAPGPNDSGFISDIFYDIASVTRTGFMLKISFIAYATTPAAAYDIMVNFLKSLCLDCIMQCSK